MRCANASATRNPALCRVSRYFSPGLPSPTTSSLDDRPTSSASGPPAGAADEPARVDRRRSAGRRTARPGRWKARQHDVAARSWRARRLMCMARERCWLRELCRAVSGKRARRRWWWEISRVVGSSRARWAAESTGPGYVRIPLSPSNSARSRNRDGSRRCTRRTTAPPRPSSGRLPAGYFPHQLARSGTSCCKAQDNSQDTRSSQRQRPHWRCANKTNKPQKRRG